jgi:hypothetical protein
VLRKRKDLMESGESYRGVNDFAAPENLLLAPDTRCLGALRLLGKAKWGLTVPNRDKGC